MKVDEMLSGVRERASFVADCLGIDEASASRRICELIAETAASLDVVKEIAAEQVLGADAFDLARVMATGTERARVLQLRKPETASASAACE